MLWLLRLWLYTLALASGFWLWFPKLDALAPLTLASARCSGSSGSGFSLLALARCSGRILWLWLLALVSQRRAGGETGLKKVAEFGSETKRKHPSAPSARPAFRSALEFFGRALGKPKNVNIRVTRGLPSKSGLKTRLLGLILLLGLKSYY